jgi:SAM-dependent methyltransferase
VNGTRHGEAYYRAVSDEVTREWRRHSDRPLRIVMGDLAWAVTFYSPDHPDAVWGFHLGLAPWVGGAARGRGLAPLPGAGGANCRIRHRYRPRPPQQPIGEPPRVVIPSRILVGSYQPDLGRARGSVMRDWIAFWDSENSIYANARHRDAHFRRIATDIAAYVPVGACVLDYGCSDALHAELVAAPARQLVLCEAAPNVRNSVLRRFGGHPIIRVCAPDALASLPAESFDLVVMQSVAQYLSQAELGALLVQFRRLLRAGGGLILGDIIPPQVGARADTLALLRFAADDGFLCAALLGLLRAGTSDYRRLRAQLGLTRYDEAEIVAKLRAGGFSAHRADANIGSNPTRMTIVATREARAAEVPAPWSLPQPATTGSPLPARI